MSIAMNPTLRLALRAGLQHAEHFARPALGRARLLSTSVVMPRVGLTRPQQRVMPGLQSYRWYTTPVEGRVLDAATSAVSISGPGGEAGVLHQAGLTEAAVAQSQTVADAAQVTVLGADQAIGGPVDVLQHLISFVHTSTGLPWWLSIALITVGIRSVLMPIALKVMRNSRILQNIQPQTQVIQKKIEQAKQASDQEALMRAATELRDLWAKHNVSPFRSLFNIAIMAPMFITFFVALRRMAASPELWPGVTTGGFSWISDLSVADPYYILPTLAGISTLITLELGADGNQQMQNSSMKWVFRLLAVSFIPFGGQFPAAVLFYWTTSNLFSILQTLALKVPLFCRLVKVPPMVSHQREEVVRPAVLFTNKPKVGKVEPTQDATIISKQ